MEKIKRTWHFVQKPNYFEISCPKCASFDLAWSEYMDHIWCYECKEDLTGYKSPFSGPIPSGTAKLLGIDLRVFNMETNKIEE